MSSSTSSATSSQSPLLCIPQKTTSEVDLATPVRSLISASYGEDPKKWMDQTNGLNRARQDAVRGAGTGDGKGKGDAVGRDLLFKWFHILEMLELRFPELRVPFPWKDAFTHKSISQHSLAYEKASIIFNIACVLTSLASSQLRSSSSEGLKRAYTSLRQAGGLFSYINDNFLHAPSTDMSREVIKCLINISMAQASEVFLEKCIEEKKGAGLVSKIASHTAGIYTGLSEDLKEWVGKGVLERSWLLCIQAKAKYVTSVTQYYKALADDAAGSHGACLVRVTLAESLAKEALRLAGQFQSFVSGSFASSQSLPSDAGPALTSVINHHLALCTERKDAAVKDNDLIYHDILPSESTLPAVEKAVAATPISVQDIYAAPEVQKVIGPDIFSKLVPLGVHESASMYSEEKAKLARAETERHDLACGELQASLEYMGLPSSLNKFRNLGKGANAAIEALADPGREVMEWSEEEARGGGSRGADGLGSGTDGVESALNRIEKLKRTASNELESLTSLLDNDNRDCEKARVRLGHRFTQEPAGAQAKGMRSDIKSNREALQAANQNDHHIKALWEEIKPEVELLIGGRERLERVFAETIASSRGSSSQKESLLDLGEAEDSADDASIRAVEEKVEQIDGIVSKLNKIKKERGEILGDLKEKIQTDDISQILILNRRAQNVEPAIFKQELEKFKPHQSRISLSINAQQSLIHELTKNWKELNDLKGSQNARKRWEEMEGRRNELIKKLKIAKEKHAEVRAATSKGVQFYTDLGEIASALSYSVKQFTQERKAEREKLIGEAEWEEKLDQPQAPSRSPLPPPSQNQYSTAPPPPASLSGAMGSMNLGDRGSMSPTHSPYSQPQPTAASSYHSNLYSQPPPPLPSSNNYSSPAPSNQSSIPTPSRAPSFPPPPQSQSSPYDSMAMFESSSSNRPPQVQPAQPTSNGYGNYQNQQQNQSNAYYSQGSTNQQAYSQPPPPSQNQIPQRAPSLPPPPPQFQSQFSPSSSPSPNPTYGAPLHQGQYQHPPPPMNSQQQFGQAPAQFQYGQQPPPPASSQYGGYPNYQNKPPPPPPSWR